MSTQELKNIFESKSGIPLEVISSFALSDAKHDFHGKLDINIDDTKKGLPENGGAKSNASNEDKILDMILGHNAELLKGGKLDLKDKLPDVSNEEKSPLPFTIQIREQGRVVYQGDKYTGVRFAPKNYKGASQGYHVCERTKMCPNGNAIFVVDFNLKLFNHMKKGGSGGSATYNIHYAFTPEVVNDPAPKTPPEDKIFARVDESKSNGVIFHSYVQTEPTNTIYDTYNPTAFPENFFMSKYTYQLSPIAAQYVKKGAPKYKTNLVINWTDENNKPYNATIMDSKDANSIQTLVGSIGSFIKKIGSFISSMFSSNKSNDYLFNYNSRLQQKRGGDWFQALCCHSVYNREFTKILPETTREHRKFFERGDWPVYFVSHDRIAVAYALLMGVNVIYTDYEQGICVFKNTKSVASAGEKPVHMLIQETLSPIIAANGGKSVFDANMDKQIDFYNKSRARIIGEYKAAVDTFFTTARTFKTKEKPDATKRFDELIRYDLFSDLFRQDVNREGAVIGKTLRILRLTDTIKFINAFFEELFRAIVMYVFAATNLVDLTEDYARVSDTKIIRLITSGAAAEAASDAETVQQITAYNDSYKRISGIMRNFEMDLSSESNSVARIKSWMETFMKKDIYKSVKLVTMVEDKNIFDKERIRLIDYKASSSEADSGADKTKRLSDRFLFLPFVSTGMPNEYKRNINGYFDLIAGEIKEFLKNPETGRSNDVKPVFSYVNTLANFMIEARIMLPVEPEPTSGAASASASAIQVSEAAIVDHFNTPEEVQKDEEFFMMNDRIQEILLEIEGFLSENFFSEDEIMYEELMEMKALRTGEKEMEDIDDVARSSTARPQSGGKTGYFNRTKPRYNGISCNISPMNITRPLLTYILARNATQSIQNFLEYDNNQRSFVETIAVEQAIQTRKRGADVAFEGAESAPRETRRVVRARRFGGAGGAAGNEVTMPIFNQSFGHHPLLPIYMILSAIWSTVERNWDSQAYLWDYVVILQKIEKTFEHKYLSAGVDKMYEAYMIGFALKVLFFTAHNKNETSDFIAREVLGLSEDDYRLFSLSNSGFSSYVSGVLYQTAEERQLAMNLMSTKLVQDFLVKEVRLPEMIQKMNMSEGTRTEADVNALNNNVFLSLSNIVKLVHTHYKNVERDMARALKVRAKTSKAVSAPVVPVAATATRKQTTQKRRSLSLNKKKTTTKRRTTGAKKASSKKTTVAFAAAKKKTSSKKRTTAVARKTRKSTKKIATTAATSAAKKRMFPGDMFGTMRKPTAAITAAAAGGAK